LPPDEKAAIIASVEANAWPLIVDGTVKAIVHTTIDIEQAREAHALVEASSHIGKVVLTT
jgi:NADPH2:quinone reductase